MTNIIKKGAPTNQRARTMKTPLFDLGSAESFRG